MALQEVRDVDILKVDNWYHKECVPETGTLTSRSPVHELCVACGYEGECVHVVINSNPDVRRIREMGESIPTHVIEDPQTPAGQGYTDEICIPEVEAEEVDEKQAEIEKLKAREKALSEKIAELEAKK